jgi:hypothetical protein
MKTELVTRVWKSGRRRAVLVAVQIDAQRYAIGYALCHKADTFTRKMGYTIAKGRAEQWGKAAPPINFALETLIYPNSIKKDMKQFEIRCTRFFKDMKPAYYMEPDKPVQKASAKDAMYDDTITVGVHLSEAEKMALGRLAGYKVNHENP